MTATVRAMRMRFRGPVLDTGALDAVAAAQFYASLLGWTVTREERDGSTSWAWSSHPRGS